MSFVVEFVELGFVDGSDTELSLDGRDQRRSLEERSGEGLEGARQLGFAAGKRLVQSDDADILFPGSLL
jgi:hypothetical protein